MLQRVQRRLFPRRPDGQRWNSEHWPGVSCKQQLLHRNLVDECQHLKRFWNKQIFNLSGGGLALISAAIPWYFAQFCGSLIAVWLFQLPVLSWLILSIVLGGGVLSILTRYGGILSLAGSFVFALTFSTSQLFTVNIGVSPTTALPPCSSGFYGVSLGFWAAILGGALSLMGKSWTFPRRIPVQFKHCP